MKCRAVADQSFATKKGAFSAVSLIAFILCNFYLISCKIVYRE